jgi:hypothetical protein
LIPEAGYGEVCEDVRAVAQTGFNDCICDETDAIMRRSPRLAKKQPPQPKHGPQMPLQVWRSLRNQKSAEVMRLAVLHIMREHEVDLNPDKTYPRTVHYDAIRKARKRSTIARFLGGALLSYVY